MSTYQKRLRANISAELGRRELTQKDVAPHLGLSAQAFGLRMTGRTDFRVGELLQLAHRFKVPLGTLLDGIDDSERAQEEEYPKDLPTEGVAN